jgi:hypothetical protein
VRIGGIGLASLTCREDPRPGGELRRNVDDVLTGGQEPHRDVVPDAVAALDRPDPVAEPADVTRHRGKPIDIGREPTATQDGLVGGHHFDRDRPLVQIHSDHHTTVRRLHPVLPLLAP